MGTKIVYNHRAIEKKWREKWAEDPVNPKVDNNGKKKNTKEIDMVEKMFTEIAPKYANRNGGYTRIVKIGQRKGDAAMEVLLELV